MSKKSKKFKNILGYSLSVWFYFYNLNITQAAPLELSQTPPTAQGSEPAPNIIISVDDSGSMSFGNRMTELKSILIRQFGDASTSPPSKGKIPDDRIRLAWQSMNDLPRLTPGETNTMRSFSGTHRLNFTKFVKSLDPGGGTPSGSMVINALKYMQTPPGIHSPWADVPGQAQTTPYASCRRSFHIFLTDGAAGSLASGYPNADGSTRTLPDGILFSANSAQTYAYSDKWSGTLSDATFLAWAQDLQPTIENGIRPLIKKAGAEKINAVTLEEYWNPKNNPATWQHITTYTIGFGPASYSWSGTPRWDNGSDSNYGGDYNRLVNGEVSWQNPNYFAVESELWHMALNSRGKFFPAVNVKALDQAFDEILNNIITDTSRPIGSVGSSAMSLNQGVMAYKTQYESASWSGTVIANKIDVATGKIDPQATWDAAALLDSSSYVVDKRFVLGFNGSAGFSWSDWNTLPAKQKNLLANGDNLGPARVAYLRGDRTNEQSQGNSGTFRDRSSRLGDIVNSALWSVGKPNQAYKTHGYPAFLKAHASRQSMLYVGANDGMLHGFAAGSGLIPEGTELLAYIPQGIAENHLFKLTVPDYQHQYFVDGHPFSADAYLGDALGWKTVLMGSLGAGGKGYFALDITDPKKFTASQANQLVIFDTTSSTDPDLGHIIAPPVRDDVIDHHSPQITKLNNNRWAVILGNGYNSSNEAPVLFIQYLDGAREIQKISPCILPVAASACSYKGSNGLSTPVPVDLNGDGRADVVYAGDLQGHLWRFDLNTPDPTQWRTGMGEKPLFVAQTSTGIKQPISTAIYWLHHPSKRGVMLVFGTGRNLTDSDRKNTELQTIFGIYDNSHFKIDGASVGIANGTVIDPNTLRTTLVAQTATTTKISSGKNGMIGSRHPVLYTGASAKRGWYIDLPFQGQRLLSNPAFWNQDEVLLNTTVPGSNTSSQNSCTFKTTPDTAYPMVINAFFGTPPSNSLTNSATSTTPSQIIGYETDGNKEIFLRTRKGVIATDPNGGRSSLHTLRQTLGTRMTWRELN